MLTDLSDVFLPLQEEIHYFISEFQNRKGYGQGALTLRIQSILKDQLAMDKTIISLLNHAFFGLNVHLKQLANSQNYIWNFPNNPFSNSITIDGIIEYLNVFLRVSDNLLRSVDISRFRGDLVKFQDDLYSYKQRLAKLTSHCIHHMGQALVLHGLLTEFVRQESWVEV